MSDGEEVNVGNELMENLKGNKILGWDFVTTEEAEKGIENMDYDMTTEDPEALSANVVTVLEPNPVKPELNFTQNEGLHFMAAQVTDNAIETLGNQLSDQVTETYVRNVFGQLGQVTDGFEEAADGSGQINDGSKQLKDGTTEILESLTGSADDVGKLADRKSTRLNSSHVAISYAVFC